MAIAQPPRTRASSTYTARAVPAGPSTTEIPASRPVTGWPPQHHKPLIAASAVAALLATPLVILYSFVASDPDTALPARGLLLTACGVLAIGSVGCFIAAWIVRAVDRAVIQGAEYGVEAVLGGRVDAAEEWLEEVEQRDVLAVNVGERLGAIEAAIRGALVVVGPREPGETPRVNGSAPAGLDPEVIDLARRIGGAIIANRNTGGNID